MDKRNLKGWLYLLPAILFLGAFMVYPLIDVFIYSFEEGYNSASQTSYGTGLYNYSYVLHDPYFLQALKKYLSAGHHYRASLHRTGPCNLHRLKLHQAPSQPVSDRLFSALCDQYSGCRAGIYDPV